MIPLNRTLKPGYKKNVLVFLYQQKYFSSIEVEKITKDTKVYEMLFYIIKYKAKEPGLDYSKLREKKIMKILEGFTCLTKKGYERKYGV